MSNPIAPCQQNLVVPKALAALAWCTCCLAFALAWPQTAFAADAEASMQAAAGSALSASADTKGTQASKTVQGAWTRLWGQNALGTMAEIANTGFGSSDTVVIATNAGYWDALSASALAGAYDAPILLTSPHKLSDETAAQIARLKAKTAFVCGGPAAVSQNVLDDIKAMGLATERIWGATATGTASALATKLGAKASNTAIVATTSSYHDALCIAPYAYASTSPVFLASSGGTTLDAATYKALSQGGFTRVVIAGGPAAVSQGVEERLKAISGVRSVVRLGGQNAYGTSVKVAEWGLSNGLSANQMGVATGKGYWDALTGAALCGKNKAVLVLVDDSNTSAVTGFINKNRSAVKKGYVFGGTAAVGSYAMAVAVSGLVESVYSTLKDVDLGGHTKVGIDVSVWNGSIDWSKVKAAGVDFAILRVGYGSDYASQDDSRFLEYVRGAKAAGIPIGVYLYSYAKSTSQASSEAAHTLRLLNTAGLKPADVPYGVFYDLEEESLAKTSNRTLLAQMATVYCTAIANAGYKVGVYSNLNWWTNYLTDPVFEKWQRWMAQYNSSCWYQGSYVMWQCKSTGKVAGITGNVDMNLYYL